MTAQALRLSLALACASAPAFAGVHIVDATGRGDQLTIAAAVAAASDGDLLLLRTGTYAGFVVDGKALVITPDVGALVTIEGTIEIENLAAGKTLVLANLRVHGPVDGLGSGPALILSNDAGNVRIEGCELDGGRGLAGGGNPWNPGAAGVEIQACPDATFVHCTIRGGDGEGTLPGQGLFDFGGDGGAAVHASSSIVNAYDCTLQGGDGGGGEGLGGDGGRGYDHAQGPGGGTFSRCTIEAGDGGYAHGWGIGGHGGDALFASSTAIHTLTDCTTLAGEGGQSTGYSPGPAGLEFAGPGTYRQLPGAARSFFPGFLAASGGQTSVEVRGQAGDRVYVIPAGSLAGSGPRAAPGASSAARKLLAGTHPLGVLSHTGTGSFVFGLSSLPIGQSLGTLALQGCVLDASGALVLGNPFSVELLGCASLAPDCNGNGAFDSCDLLDGSAQDLAHDGIPDSCDPDCNGNGLPDDLDILNGTSDDQNGNGIPDSCEGPHIVYVDAAAAPFGDGSSMAPFQTIGQGIAAAVTGDHVLVADGTYSGPLNRDLDFGGRSIVVRSANGPTGCIVDSQLAGRAFVVNDGELAGTEIRGFTIRNGQVNQLGWGSSFGGGGIIAFYSTLRIENCRFETCRAQNGGGAVFGQGSDVALVGCTFVGNGQPTTYSPGGALRLVGGSACSVRRCTFEQNSGSAGGALICDGNGLFLQVESCTFRGNQAVFYGGGAVMGSAGLVDNCLFTGNTAPNGAGVSGHGGVTLVHCTIQGNSATQSAGGVYCAYVGVGPTFSLRDTIIWGNTAPAAAQIGSVSFSDTLQLRYCDLQGGAAGIAIGGGVLDYDATNFVLDPQFVSPAGPDGNPATWADNDLRLGPISPCVDAGNNALVPPDVFDLDGDTIIAEPVPYDLDGLPRFRDIPGVIDTGVGSGPITDLGAYERQP